MKDRSLRAAALQYKENTDTAPKVTAKGRGIVAEEIIRIAAENDIAVKDDPDLLEILYKLDIDTEIPPEVYTAVAEILAYVYQTNEKYKARYGAGAMDGKTENQPVHNNEGNKD